MTNINLKKYLFSLKSKIPELMPRLIKKDLSEIILITDVEYTLNALKVILTTPKRVLKNYIGWRFISNFGKYSSEQFRKSYYSFIKVLTGMKKTPERESTCRSLPYYYLDFALSQLFVKDNFTEKEKNSVSNMVDAIQSSYRQLIVENDWLDNQTRVEALKKLDNVRKNVAYPPWLLNNRELDSYYNLKKNEVRQFLSRRNYLVTLPKFAWLQVKKMIMELDLPVDPEREWPFPPAIVNAAYMFSQNSISKKKLNLFYNFFLMIFLNL